MITGECVSHLARAPREPCCDRETWLSISERIDPAEARWRLCPRLWQALAQHDVDESLRVLRGKCRDIAKQTLEA